MAILQMPICVGYGTAANIAAGLANDGEIAFGTDTDELYVYYGGTVYSFGTGGGGGGSPGGSDTNVQYNESGAFAGDGNFVWEYAYQTLSLTGASGNPTLLAYNYPYSAYLADAGSYAAQFSDGSREVQLCNGAYSLDDNAGTWYIDGVPYQWPSSQGGASTFLENDGSGNLTWGTPSSGGGIAIGDTVSDGDDGDILFVDGSGNLGQNDAFTYDSNQSCQNTASAGEAAFVGSSLDSYAYGGLGVYDSSATSGDDWGAAGVYGWYDGPGAPSGGAGGFLGWADYDLGAFAGGRFIDRANTLSLCDGAYAINDATGAWEINGVAYQWPSSESAGVLLNDGSGNLTWGAAGGGAIEVNSTPTSGGAAGGIWYDDGSLMQELAIGSNGDVLTVVSGGPAWAAAGSLLAIGNAVGSGISSYLLYVDSGGDLAQDANLQWDAASQTLTTIGTTGNPAINASNGSYFAEIASDFHNAAAYFGDGTNSIELCNGTLALSLFGPIGTNQASAGSLVAYNLPWYDASGSLLGYMPLYSSPL